MAGCSLTLVFLDDELEALWRAPDRHPGLPQGHCRRQRHTGRRTASHRRRADEEVRRPRCPPRPARCAATAGTAILAAIADAIDDAADELGRIDAVAGDGDHGRGMVKGTSAARRRACTARAGGGCRPGAQHRRARPGPAKAGGTSGVLWGAALAAVGDALGDDCRQITGGRRRRRHPSGPGRHHRLGQGQGG